MLQTNFICPCCAYRLHFSPEIFRTILALVADDYGLTPHEVEWATSSTKLKAREARNVAVYFLRSFTGEMFKTINQHFHWIHSSSNASVKYAQVEQLMDEDPGFALRMERLQERLMDALKNLAEKKVA